MKNDKALELIDAKALNFIAAGTTMGREAHSLLFASLRGEFGKGVCDPSFFNNGFPFRIWRKSGLASALGREGSSFAIDGQAQTATEAVEMAGADGVIVTSMIG